MQRLAAALLTLLAVGCASLECTVDERYAIRLELTEVGGPRAEPISIRYRVDGGPWVEIPDTEEATAMTIDGTCRSRTSCSIGLELDGAYEIEVVRGAVTVRAETTVGADRCHVQERTLPLELPDA